MSEPILEIRDLKVDGVDGHGVHPILKGISLELRAGEVLGLIGESGAGKSTLGLAALGYFRHGCHIVGGDVLYRGRNLLALPPRQVRGIRGRAITYVAQSAASAFNPAFRLWRQIGETAFLDGAVPDTDIRMRITALLRTMSLPDPEHFGLRFPHQASGGQLQRAMTAMALTPQPDIVVLDEPTTALDVTTQIEVLAEIKKAIRESGSAALYISHDLALVGQVSDRIMVLRHGDVVEVGETAQVLHAPTKEYTQSLLSVRHGTPDSDDRAETRDDVLRVEKLCASYGAMPVLHDIDIRVRRGTTTAIVGESGSGKSTLARVATGLMAPTAGKVRFDGKVLPKKLSARDLDVLRRMQIIFQASDAAMNPRHVVGDIIGRPLVRYFRMGRDACRARVEQLLGEVGLPATFARRRPGELSGGQMQRVCIARALAAEPELIFCDEVTSALDRLVARDILQLLRRLQQEKGIAYVFITHDLEAVQAMAHDIVVMRHGRVVDQGPAGTVLSPPFHPYTSELIDSIPTLEDGWLERAFAHRQEAERLLLAEDAREPAGAE